MKKLNRKGFTLIELLAVVVILAVILVVTIPSVLDTMDEARQKSLDDVAAIIQDYAQKQYEQCELNLDKYDTTVFTRNATTGVCSFVNNYSTPLITAAGYDATKDLDTVTATIDATTKKISVTAITTKGNGQFKGKSYSKS